MIKIVSRKITLFCSFILVFGELDSQNHFVKQYGFDVTESRSNSLIERSGRSVIINADSDTSSRITCFDTNGMLAWSYEHTFSGQQSFQGFSGIIRTGSQYIVGGHQDSCNFLIALDTSGQLLWSIELCDSLPYAMGISDMTTDTDGNIYVYTEENAGNGIVPKIIKLDSNANVLWAKCYTTGSGNNARSILYSEDLNQIVFSMQRLFSVVLCFADVNGVVIRAIDEGMMANTLLAPSNEGGFLLAGSFTWNSNDLVLIKTDSAGVGTTRWYYLFPLNLPSQVVSAIASDDSGMVYFGTTSFNSTAISSVCIGKVGQGGAPVWVRRLDGDTIGFSGITEIEILNNGEMLTTGLFPYDGQQLFIARQDTSALPGCVGQLDSISFQVQNHMYSPIVLQDTIANTDVRNITFIIASAFAEQQFLCTTEILNNPIDENCVAIFPNPSLGNINIAIGANHAEFRLYNATGQLFYSIELDCEHNEIALPASILPGVYFYQITSGENTSCSGKLAIMR